MNTHLKRRDFLKNSLYASMAAGAGLGLSLPARALAACTAVPMPRTLVNIMLYGGMDSRFIFMPAPNHDAQVGSTTDYLNKLWVARANLYGIAYPSYQDLFTANYDLVTDAGSGFQFGVYKRCGWLKAEFDAGRAAVIANSFCSKNRRHDQSQLNANVGEPAFSGLIYDRDGWGGRLAEQLGTANTVELSREISVFGNSTVAGQRLDNVIHAQNTRDIALPNIRTDRNVGDDRNVMTRALKSYYQARGLETAGNPADWPFHLFFQHNTAFREFGDAVKDRLDSCGLPPASLSGLALYSNHFEQQCRNLYDVCLAPDILDVGTISMRYDGWDTHNKQIARIGNNLEDLFGASGGLATAMSEIALLPAVGPQAADQLTYCFTSDFGRQLKANGDNGTDHGRGIYTILVGSDVSGGVYGEMFPERESIEVNSKFPLDTSGADIEGRTSTERIFAQACEWMQPGSSGAVFPDAGSSDIEIPNMLDNLFA